MHDTWNILGRIIANPEFRHDLDTLANINNPCELVNCKDLRDYLVRQGISPTVHALVELALMRGKNDVWSALQDLGEIWCQKNGRAFSDPEQLEVLGLCCADAEVRDDLIRAASGARRTEKFLEILGNCSTPFSMSMIVARRTRRFLRASGVSSALTVVEENWIKPAKPNVRCAPAGTLTGYYCPVQCGQFLVFAESLDSSLKAMAKNVSEDARTQFQEALATSLEQSNLTDITTTFQVLL